MTEQEFYARPKANFKMRGFTPELINTYNCVNCKESGVDHQVLEQPFRETTERSHWGGGYPTTIRECSGCGRVDGPWVSADLVGGGW